MSLDDENVNAKTLLYVSDFMGFIYLSFELHSALASVLGARLRLQHLHTPVVAALIELACKTARHIKK
jgi:hypothetical protein